MSRASAKLVRCLEKTGIELRGVGDGYWAEVDRIKEKKGKKGRERQFIEHEELIYWIYTRLGLDHTKHVWAWTRALHCFFFPMMYSDEMRVWRTGRRWPPFETSCASMNYAFYVLELSLVTTGMYGHRLHLLLIREKLGDSLRKDCDDDPEMLGKMWLALTHSLVVVSDGS